MFTSLMERKNMKNFNSIILQIFRIILASVFIYAGLIKLLSPESFFETLQEYRLLSSNLSYILAYLLPPFEIILGVGLFLNRYAKVCAYSIIFLNVIFIFAIASVWIRGIDISCGCFGQISSLTNNYLWDILRDIILIILALSFILIYIRPNNNKL